MGVFKVNNKDTWAMAADFGVLLLTLTTFSMLTLFSPIFNFYNPWKHQKTFGFLTFSGGIEMVYWGLKWAKQTGL